MQYEPEHEMACESNADLMSLLARSNTRGWDQNSSNCCWILEADKTL